MARRALGPALAVIALLVSTVALGFAVFGTESDAAAGAEGGGGTTTVDVMLMEFAVTPAVIEVPAGHTLVLNVTNDGAMVHDLKLNGESPLYFGCSVVGRF